MPAPQKWLAQRALRSCRTADPLDPANALRGLLSCRDASLAHACQWVKGLSVATKVVVVLRQPWGFLESGRVVTGKFKIELASTAHALTLAKVLYTLQYKAPLSQVPPRPAFRRDSSSEESSNDAYRCRAVTNS